MQKEKLNVREFEAHGEDWQAVCRPSLKHHPSRLVSGILRRSAHMGILFVSQSGERRFIPMPIDEFPTRSEFDKLTRIELVELLERALPTTE